MNFIQKFNDDQMRRRRDRRRVMFSFNRLSNLNQMMFTNEFRVAVLSRVP